MTPATFRSVDSEGIASFVTDDGRVLWATAEVIAASVFIMLRVGQRVAATTGADTGSSDIIALALPQ